MSAFDLIHVETRSGVVVARPLVRDLREPTEAMEIGRQLNAAVAAAGSSQARLAVDLHKVRYMCSTGFATLLNLARSLSSQGGRMAVFGLQPDVRVGANIISLGQFLPIHDDESSAIAALTGESAGGS
jgi:anti-anti-sigma factor